MIQEIKYTGVSTAPSEREAPDGALALSLDLINETGSLHSILPPDRLLQIPEGFTLLCVHHVQQGDNYIFTHLDWRRVPVGDGSIYEIDYEHRTVEFRYASASAIDAVETGQPTFDSRTANLAAILADTSSRICSVDADRIVAHTITGNVVTFATGSEMSHLYWVDQSYRLLPQAPPMIPLEFALGKGSDDKNLTEVKPTAVAYRTYDPVITTEDRTVWSDTGNNTRRAERGGEVLFVAETNPNEPSCPFTTGGRRSIANAYFGVYNAFRNEQMNLSRFIEPFFICYALRLYDGSHVQVSAPVLMVPPAPLPYQFRTHGGEGGMDGSCRAAFNTWGMFSYNLLARKGSGATASIMDALDQWGDLVLGIDIFISAPIYRLDYNKLPQADWPWSTTNCEARFFPNEKFADEIKSCHTFYRLRTLSVKDLKAMFTRSDAEYRYNQIVGDPIQVSPDLLVTREELKESMVGNDPVVPAVEWTYNSRLTLGDLIRSRRNLAGLTSMFYQGHRAIHEGYDYIGKKSAYVEVFCKDAEGWYMRRSYPVIMSAWDCPVPFIFVPDPNARFGRVHVPATGWLVEDYVQIPADATSPSGGSGGSGGSNESQTSQNSQDSQSSQSSQISQASLSDDYTHPVWVIPDKPAATVDKADLTTVDGTDPGTTFQPPKNASPEHTYWVEFTRHEYLHGAYHLSGEPLHTYPLAKTSASESTSKVSPYASYGYRRFALALKPCSWDDVRTPPSTLTPELKTLFLSMATSPSEAVRRSPSEVVCSETNNPFVLPAANYTTVGSGRVLAFSSAAKALSQGQFGQFPVYAFTDEGVWALESGSSGAFVARQPITRDVVANPSGIVQIDTSVLFPAERGIMQLSGSEAQCISDTLANDWPFNLFSLPHFDKLHAMLGHGLDSCIPQSAFSNFLRRCNMIYDYPHQRIYAYRVGEDHAYVFSLRSALWAVARGSIAYDVNSYPQALAVTADRVLLDYSRQQPAKVKGMLVTRPLGFGESDVYKTVRSALQRGDFPDGAVKCALYGSRDLRHWHLVASSVNARIRNISGTPYKFFRLLIITDFNPEDTLSGASLDVAPRLTNHLR